MFNFDQEGMEMGHIEGGEYDNELLHVDYFEDGSDSDEDELVIDDGIIVPHLNPTEREVAYIAGPSGSGKSTVASVLAEGWLQDHPRKPVYIISRTDYKEDPAWKHLPLIQIKVDESLVNDPVDITQDVTEATLIIFDDVGTIMDNKQRIAVEKMICDILEVGRKLKIWVIVTNHLIIPNEKKFARTMLNEMQSLYVFPRSGSAQQIRYVLKQYFGLDKHQIERIVKLRSRWVKIRKTAPQYVMYDKGAYIL